MKIFPFLRVVGKMGRYVNNICLKKYKEKLRDSYKQYSNSFIILIFLKKRANIYILKVEPQKPLYQHFKLKISSKGFPHKPFKNSKEP